MATLAYSELLGALNASRAFKVGMDSRASVGTDSLRVNEHLPGGPEFFSRGNIAFTQNSLRAPRAGLGLPRAGGWAPSAESRGPLGTCRLLGTWRA